MRAADDFHDLGGGLFEWSAYNSAAKIDLHAHALVLPETGQGAPGRNPRVVFLDPIALRPAALEELLHAAGGDGNGAATPAAVLVTNGNHARAADDFRRQFRVPVFAAGEARAALREDGLEIDEEFPAAAAAGAADAKGSPFVGDALRAIPLPGFAHGETAIFAPHDGGTLLIGDALIYLAPPYDFVPLPKKYCTAPKITADSLRRLLDLPPFSRMTFAHGNPLLSGAHARLAALLHAAA